MIWYILIAIIVATLLWILFGPVVIFLNTDLDRYFLALPGIFKAAVVPADGLFHIRGWIFFIPFTYNPILRKKRKRGKRPEKEPAGVRPKKLTGGVRMATEMVRSFRIRRLLLDIDTDDFVLNAWLVPLFSFVNYENIQMRVNFEGTASMHLEMRNRMATMLWIFIKNRL
jgi:hypothetical protein